jgi:catechol 2,3-dioxygenase-like lactoylglutathione lyase family enzyme
MIDALESVEVVTLFVEDLAACESFYKRVFRHDEAWRDDVCVILRIGNLSINLLQSGSAAELVAPQSVGQPGQGPRMMFTVRVDDVDRCCVELADRGVALVNGPMDRPWGRRTAAFADPAGHIWEVAQELA